MTRSKTWLLAGSVLLAGGLSAGDLAAETIGEIQGAGHLSPFRGQTVETTGVATAVGFNGFYLQDPEGDGDDATSEGIFVSTESAPTVTVGDDVVVTGLVSEFIPGGAATGNLSTTRIESSNIKVSSSGNPLPEPVVIGRWGRIPPNRIVISDDELPLNLQEVPGAFDPEEDGIDFYEALEGMRVTIDDPVAISAVRTFNSFSSEFFTLPSRGRLIAPRNARTIRKGGRAGIALQPDPDNLGDQNPERVQVQIDGTLFPGPVPEIKVGDRLGDVTGVMGYSFGNFEVQATELFDVKPSALRPERSWLRGTSRHVTVASYNVLNLSPDASDDAQRATVAAHIAHNLNGPDVVALQEIQDNSGETDDGVTDATETLQALADAIVAAGGPSYAFFDVAPEDGTSGGVPGGNIRNAFLYNPERVDLIGFVSLTPKELAGFGVGDPTAFEGTRDPLLARFGFESVEVVVINNHFTSRFGSTPIFGGPQPFVQAGEDEREAQVLALHEVTRTLLGDEGSANIAVVGDLNTFDWTNDLAKILPQGRGGKPILFNLLDSLGRKPGTAGGNDHYTFIFDGNAQALDHFFVSGPLTRSARFDVVHVNVDFPRIDASTGSDHEPLLARLRLHKGYKR